MQERKISKLKKLFACALALMAPAANLLAQNIDMAKITCNEFM